jgi:hypothetical protein
MEQMSGTTAEKESPLAAHLQCSAGTAVRAAE